MKKICCNLSSFFKLFSLLMVSKTSNTFFYTVPLKKISAFVSIFLHSPHCKAEGCVNMQWLSWWWRWCLMDQSEWGRSIETVLWLVDTVHKGYLTSENRFCSIVSKSRLALPSVQSYSAVAHSPIVNSGWTKFLMYISRTDPSAACAQHVCARIIR